MKKQIYITVNLILFLAVVAAGFAYFRTAIAGQSTVIEATIKISICGNDVAEGGEHCDNDDLKGKNCTDLGFSGGNLSCLASCKFDISNCTTSAETIKDEEFMYSSGGEFIITNNDNTTATITLFENFYSADLWLLAFSYANDYFSSSKPTPANKNFIGKTYDFMFIDPNGNTVSTLSKSATVAFTYSEADISGIDENTLAPYRWGADDSSWQLISGATIDTANNTVTFSTDSFGSFAVFGESEETEPEPSSGGGGGGGFFRFLKPKPTPKPEPKPSKPKPDPDFNDDGKINIVDLSILLFWYGKTGSEIIPYDLNEDNMIDIADVSILFYYWKD